MCRIFPLTSPQLGATAGEIVGLQARQVDRPPCASVRSEFGDGQRRAGESEGDSLRYHQPFGESRQIRCGGAVPMEEHHQGAGFVLADEDHVDVAESLFS
jgi:hypothetical protein